MDLEISRYLRTEPSCTVKVRFGFAQARQTPLRGMRRNLALHFGQRTLCFENFLRFPMRSGRKWVPMTAAPTAASSTARILRANSIWAVILSIIEPKVLYAEAAGPAL